MTPERLAEIQKRAKRATPGPWVSRHGQLLARPDTDDCDIVLSCCNMSERTLEFVAASRDDVPDLLAALAAERARADAAEARLALLADWAIDAGGWRLFHYSARAVPEEIFDLSDTFNPELTERMRAILAAEGSATVGEEGRVSEQPAIYSAAMTNATLQSELTDLRERYACLAAEIDDRDQATSWAADAAWAALQIEVVQLRAELDALRAKHTPTGARGRPWIHPDDLASDPIIAAADALVDAVERDRLQPHVTSTTNDVVPFPCPTCDRVTAALAAYRAVLGTA